MTARPLFFHLCLMTLLIPTLGWAANEAADSIISPNENAITAPEQSVPVKPDPVQPAPVQPVPHQSAPVKPAPAQPAPVKPVPVKPVPIIPAPAVPAAPVLTIKPAPINPAPASGTREPLPPLLSSQTIDIEVFIREDCLQCDKAREFLAKLQNLRPQLKIIIRDVRKEPAALELLKRMIQNQGATVIDYPAFVVGGQLIIGFSEELSTAQLILDSLATSNPTNQHSNNNEKNCESGNEISCGLIPPSPVVKPGNIVISVFGYSVPLSQIGLPLFTLAMGLLDGLNYGSTWALILMISLLSPMKNRPLMLAVAGTFITAQGIVYLALMAAWFNLLLRVDITQASQIVFASIAFIAGAIYFKNYMHFGQNISISSHEIAKPGIYTRIRKIVQAQNLVYALLGTIALAILVQLSELTYKSVLPALYTRVLTLQKLDSLSNYGYLLLYDFAYMLDDIIVLIMAVITLKQNRSQEKQGRLLKLISGLIMVGLGGYLLRTQL